MTTGYAGGDTRFQVFARVLQRRAALGITLKVDLPDDDLPHRLLVALYAGANWHERETWRCTASPSRATPACATCTCPPSSRATRCARTSRCWPGVVKPWPGIVDVEPMPGEPEGDGDEADGEAPT